MHFIHSYRIATAFYITFRSASIVANLTSPHAFPLLPSPFPLSTNDLLQTIRMHLQAYILLSILVLIPFSIAAPAVSPEPQVDPLFPATLYVVSAGDGARGPQLQDGSNICPDDYPIGFSILCETAGPVRKVNFFVDGEFVKTEYRVPYYIAGDYESTVAAWTTFPSSGVIMCSPSGASSVSASVSFTC